MMTRKDLRKVFGDMIYSKNGYKTKTYNNEYVTWLENKILNKHVTRKQFKRFTWYINEYHTIIFFGKYYYCTLDTNNVWKRERYKGNISYILDESYKIVKENFIIMKLVSYAENIKKYNHNNLDYKCLGTPMMTCSGEKTAYQYENNMRGINRFNVYIGKVEFNVLMDNGVWAEKIHL